MCGISKTLEVGTSLGSDKEPNCVSSTLHRREVSFQDGRSSFYCCIFPFTQNAAVTSLRTLVSSGIRLQRQFWTPMTFRIFTVMQREDYLAVFGTILVLLMKENVRRVFCRTSTKDRFPWPIKPGQPTRVTLHDWV